MHLHDRFGNYEGLAELKGDVYKLIHSMYASNLTWKDIAWLTSITKLPIIAKGILTGSVHVLLSLQLHSYHNRVSVYTRVVL